MVPSIEEVEEYLASLEGVLFSSLSAVTPDLPDIRESIDRLWLDVSRYGPSGFNHLKDIHIPGLGEFEVPPPPPAPPIQKSWVENSADWACENPWKASGIATGVIGAGLLVGYGVIHAKKVHLRNLKAVLAERRQVVGELTRCRASYNFHFIL
jgi:hypothetical protein